MSSLLHVGRRWLVGYDILYMFSTFPICSTSPLLRSFGLYRLSRVESCWIHNESNRIRRRQRKEKRQAEKEKKTKRDESTALIIITVTLTVTLPCLAI